MFQFNDFQVQNGLSDAGYSGAKYTWFNNRQEAAQIWMRLDRVLLNGSALSFLPGLKVVSDSWSTVCHNNPLLTIALKLKALRQRLKTWNWCTFGNTTRKLRDLAAEAANIEESLQVSQNDHLAARLVVVKQALISTQRNHYQMLADKARANWVAEGKQLPSCKSSTNLVLIPKNANVTKIEQLHPISLCNFIHKIISGILNVHLSKVLPLIISPEQSGFMPNRNMTEAIALAHDLTCHNNNGRPGGNIIMKIDMSKAYDRVSWLFLLKAMHAFGFNQAWCDLINRLISNCWYSVLWDASPYGHFKSNQA
ncbi:hypothetical protein QQ045_003789 [Rhodiola kirilowii]